MISFVRMQTFVAVALLAGAAGACATSGYEKAESAADSMSTLTLRLASCSAQVDSTLASLNALRTAGGQDLRPLFRTFASAVDTYDGAASDVRTRTEKMESRTEDYLAAWEKEAAAYRNPEMKKLSEERRATAQDSFTKLMSAGAEVKAAQRPFEDDLADIRRFLSNDLTAAGVTSVNNSIDRANADGAGLKTAMAKMSTELDRVHAELSAHQAAR